MGVTGRGGVLRREGGNDVNTVLVYDMLKNVKIKRLENSDAKF